MQTLKPLHELALKLRKGAPLYMRCDHSVYPSWTKKRAQTWTLADRKIPCGSYDSTTEYVAAFDAANHLKTAHVCPAELERAAA